MHLKVICKENSEPMFLQGILLYLHTGRTKLTSRAMYKTVTLAGVACHSEEPYQAEAVAMVRL